MTLLLFLLLLLLLLLFDHAVLCAMMFLCVFILQSKKHPANLLPSLYKYMDHQLRRMLTFCKEHDALWPQSFSMTSYM